MKKLTKYLSRGIALLICVGLLSACTSISNQPADARWANYQQWDKINKQPITGDHTRFLGGLHRGEQGVREVYVNDVGSAAAQQEKGPYNYPIGTIIVKEQYKSLKNWQEQKGSDLTIMVKVADSAPNVASDWLWSRGYGKAAKEDPFCSGCHTIAVTNDFSFSNSESLQPFQ